MRKVLSTMLMATLLLGFPVLSLLAWCSLAGELHISQLSYIDAGQLEGVVKTVPIGFPLQEFTLQDSSGAINIRVTDGMHTYPSRVGDTTKQIAKGMTVRVYGSVRREADGQNSLFVTMGPPEIIGGIRGFLISVSLGHWTMPWLTVIISFGLAKSLKTGHYQTRTRDDVI